MNRPMFIDLCADSGGLSLGLSYIGRPGLLATERDSMAFRAFEDNVLGDSDVSIPKFTRPGLLEFPLWSNEELLGKHHDCLDELRGKVDVIAGASTCQGFRLTSRCQRSDPRHQLFEKYKSSRRGQAAFPHDREPTLDEPRHAGQ